MRFLVAMMGCCGCGFGFLFVVMGSCNDSRLDKQLKNFESSTLEIEGGYNPDSIFLTQDPSSPTAHKAELPFPQTPTKLPMATTTFLHHHSCLL